MTIAVLASLVAAPTSAHAQTSTKFPIIFESQARLAEVGIAINWWDAKDHKNFPNRCYYYGDGGYTVSVSDAFLARYTARGFSLNSLCLGLISEARFNPETGVRLATYVLFNRKQFQQNAQGRDFKSLTSEEFKACCSEPGIISEELPIAVPDCFKNGTPYLDCNWRYGLKTGVKVKDATRENFRNTGKFLDELARQKIKDGSYCSRTPGVTCVAERWDNVPSSGAQPGFAAGYLKAEADYVMPFAGENKGVIRSNEKAGRAFLNVSKATLLDVSANFPRGYGYALNASGEAGPAISVASINSAIGDGVPESQIDAAQIQSLLDE
jgi:hypothetical protein